MQKFHFSSNFSQKRSNERKSGFGCSHKGEQRKKNREYLMDFSCMAFSGH
jgi:hypothetical protein